MLRLIISCAAALALGSCAKPADDTTLAKEAASAVTPAPPTAQLTDNAHPAEMATHCLRALGALTEGPAVDRCKAEGLWAAATGRVGPMSDRCLLYRLIFEAYVIASDARIIPSGSPGLYQTHLGLNDCIVAGELVQFAPFDYEDRSGEDDRLAFISFALRAIGEGRKWSEVSGIGSTDLAGMCRAFEVATDEAIKRQARDALGCYW